MKVFSDYFLTLAAGIVLASASGCDIADNAEEKEQDAGPVEDDNAETDAGYDAGGDEVLDWVSITGGSFEMGWFDPENSESDEWPMHEVNVPDFQISRTEVTLAQYSECLEASECTPPAFEHFRCNHGLAGRENHPMNCVNWEQAGKFCAWASGRLPTEAEWEYAARGRGKVRVFPWGDDPGTCDLAVMSEDGNGCGQDSTWPVCSRPDGNTEQGLCDMAGNVNEWCQDWYHNSYEGAPADGSAWEEPEGTKRIVRGGSLYTVDYALRTTSRFSKFPLRPPENYVKGTLGFRCAR